MGISASKPQQPFAQALMHHVSPKEAQATEKELGMIALLTAPFQQHSKADGCSPPDATSTHVTARIQQEQLQPITSTRTASAGTS